MNYLISFSIGPVQEFISAARRTADLKAGSDLLLKIVGAAAECAKAHGDIIYAGANKILFVTSNCDDPRQVTLLTEALRKGLQVSASAFLTSQHGRPIHTVTRPRETGF